jgi:hypothetical protein
MASSRKEALDAAKDRQRQIIDEQAIKEIELFNAQTAREKNKIQNELNKLLKEEASVRARIANYEDKSKEIYDTISESLQDQIKLLQKKKGISNETNSLETKAADLQAKIQDAIINQTGDVTRLQTEYKEVNKQLQAHIKLLEAAEESAKNVLSDISNAISKVPVIGSVLSKSFNAFLKSNKGKTLATNIASKLFNPNAIRASQGNTALLGAGAAVTAAGIKAGLAREQELKDQQRSLGLTNEQSITIDRMQRKLLNTSGNMVVSLEDARKASAELIDDFGVIGASTSEMVKQQVDLTKAYGLQAEEATNLQKAAKINGQSTEEMKIDILATAEGFNKAKGSSYSLSGIMKTVSKLSDSVRLQFRGSNTELTAAVMKAKALGTTLEDLNGIADGLLNIESSIEAQVTAQLVTGRNINMDRARMFALMDDMPGLMDELVKQEIDYASYSKMNRIEKQSTAAALGMNVDQMAKFVSQQELSKQLGIDMADAQNQTADGLENSLKSRQEEIAKLAKSGNLAAKQYERDNEALTTQEKMTAAVEQMAYLFKIMAPVVVGIGVAMMAFAVAAMMAMGSLTLGISIGAGVAAAVAAYAFLPGAATGGEVVGGSGPVVVGENGPEIVRLKKGNVVTPNDQLTNLASNNKPAPAPIVNVSLVVGNTAINEIGNKISMNQNYNQGVGNTYNRLG